MRSIIIFTSLALLNGASPAAARDKPSEVPFYGRSPPIYPSPVGKGQTSPSWTRAYRLAAALVSQMTVEEKVNLTRGWPGSCVGNSGAVTRLGIPPICFADAPDGVRGQEFVSSFPAAIHLAATFDEKLMYQYGYALGSEFYGKGINVALGPVAGPLGRIARGGRNWEGLSNDPYLAGVGMGALTKGMQDAGVIATPKHFLLNEQEFRRRESSMGEAISSNVDDRTLHELYVFPFMDSLREGAGSVMCSYQRANHSYGCQNSKLLNGILKTELGFEGFVVSDWDAQSSGVASANAGLDVVMPGAGFWGRNLTQAVNNGSVSHERLSDMATRLLASWHLLRQEYAYPPPAVYNNLQRHRPVDVQADHGGLIREIGAAGTVLVKNVGGALPLRRPRFLCVFGYDAAVKAVPWVNRDRFGGGYEVNFGWETMNGTLITAGGSGGSTPPYVVSPFQAIQERISQDRGVLRWDFWSENPTPYYNAEACLVFINAYASESFDRQSLTDGFSDRLVGNVAANCSNTIVVVHSAGIRTVDAWVEHENVTAVVFAGLPGQESGHSLADVLYGDVNPSGRLPYTVARREDDYEPVLNSTTSTTDFFPNDDFSEGLYIDYRAFDRDGVEPRFEFGFGLSYTTFGYGGFETLLVRSPGDGNTNGSSSSPPELPDAAVPIIQGGHPQLWGTVAVVRARVTNTGEVEGAEVAQLYVGVPGAGDDTPARQLRGFKKVGPLSVGETRPVAFELTRRDLSVWDVVAQQWRLRRGRYDFFVGASSRDLRVNGTLQIT